MSSFAVEFTWLYRFFAASIAFCQVSSRSHRETDFLDPFRRSRSPWPGAVLHEFIVIVIGDASRLCICSPRFLISTSSTLFSLFSLSLAAFCFVAVGFSHPLPVRFAVDSECVHFRNLNFKLTL